MKTQTIIIAFLLALLITGSTIGNTFIPIGWLLPIILVLLICIVYYLLKILNAEKIGIEEKIRNINTDINNAKSELLREQNILLERIMIDVTEKHCNLQDLYNKGIAIISQESINNKKAILEQLSQHSVFLEKKIDTATEQIKSLELVARNLYEHTLNNIDSKTEEIKNNIEAYTNSIIKIYKEDIEKICSQISDLYNQEKSSRESLSLSLYEIKQKTEELKQLIESYNESANIYASKLEEKLDSTKLQADDISKNIESVKQLNFKLQDSIAANNTLITSGTENIITSTNQNKKEVLNQLHQNSESISSNFDKCVALALSTIIKGIEDSREVFIKSEDNIIQSCKEQSQNVEQVLEEIKNQYSVIENRIEKTQDSVNEKTEKLSDTLTLSVNEIKDKVESENIKNNESLKTNFSVIINKIEESSNNTVKANNKSAELLTESINKRSDNISNKIDTLVIQNQALTSVVKASIDLKKVNGETLKSVKQQCDYLQKGITSLQIQSNNIEKIVSEYTTLNTNTDIIDSIKSLITTLQKELKSSVSEINDEILETQIKQETTNGQIEKLQILLKNISSELDEKNKKNSSQSTFSQGISTSTESTSQSWSTSNSHKDNQAQNRNKQTGQSSANAYTKEKNASNPNRIETIVDKETNNIVLNHYINDVLVKSTMKNKHGYVLYELEYKNGQIVRSRNYDEKGNLNIEQTYYDNGQVHFRNEITKGKKKSTEFDRNGNRK